MRSAMTFQELKFLWYADLYRYGGKTGARSCLSQLLFNPG